MYHIHVPYTCTNLLLRLLVTSCAISPINHWPVDHCGLELPRANFRARHMQSVPSYTCVLPRQRSLHPLILPRIILAISSTRIKFKNSKTQKFKNSKIQKLHPKNLMIFGNFYPSLSSILLLFQIMYPLQLSNRLILAHLSLGNLIHTHVGQYFPIKLLSHVTEHIVRYNNVLPYSLVIKPY